MTDVFAALEREVEADLEDRFVRLVKARFPGAKIRKGGWPNRRGAADRAVLLPGAIIAFAELKNGAKGRVSGNQKKERDELVGLGFLAEVIRTDEDVVAFVRSLERRVEKAAGFLR